jgi:hypothetical protein
VKVAVTSNSVGKRGALLPYRGGQQKVRRALFAARFRNVSYLRIGAVHQGLFESPPFKDVADPQQQHRQLLERSIRKRRTGRRCSVVYVRAKAL